MSTIQIKMRVFVPKGILDSARVMANIKHTMIQNTMLDLRKEFAKTYSTWDHQPNFSQDEYWGTNVMWVKIFTYSIQYRLVNAGTAPHEIRPRRARMLRFQNGFRAKTRPRFIGSVAGGKFGNYVSRRAVHHPGFEAREFDSEIAESYFDTFAEDIQKAIKDAIP